MKRKKFLLNVLLFLIPTATLGIPLVSWELLLRSIPEKVEHNSVAVGGHSYFDRVEDPREGIRLRKYGVYHMIHDFKGEGTFKTRYSMTNRRRVVPEVEKNRPRFLALFGCSMVFGVAVNDNQTMPYYLGKLLPAYEPYNLGIPAGSIPNTLYQIEHHDLGITQAEGVGVFLYYDFHINRIVFDWADYAAAHGAMSRPEYVWTPQGAVFAGTMPARHPWAIAWGDFAAHSKLYRKYIAPINYYSATDAKLVADLARQMQQAFQRKFPGQRFVFAVWRWRGTQFVLPEILEGVRALGVETIVLNEEHATEQAAVRDWTYLSDGHMTAASNEALAHVLMGRLQL